MRVRAIAVCVVLIFPVSSLAQSVDDVECDVSKQVHFTLSSTETDDNKYIYPVMSGHPDTYTQTTINQYISDLARTETGDKTQIEAWSEIRLNKYNFLSILHRSEAYGVSPSSRSSELKCTNLELDTGDEINLEKVLRPGYEKALPKVLKENVKGEFGRRVPKYMRSVLSELSSDWQLDNNQEFYVTKQDLVLCFEDMAFGEQSLGMIEVPIPFAALDDLINRNGPLAFARESYVPATPPLEAIQASIPTPSTEVAVEPVVATIPSVSEIISDTNNIEPGGALPNTVNGAFDYVCVKEDALHRITVNDGEPGSPYVCRVDYLKDKKSAVLWRSFKDREFCIQKAANLVRKYQTRWNWQCYAQ